MTKNVVVFGASGMLGHKMLQILSSRFNVTGTLRGANRSQILEEYNLYEGVDVKNFVSVTTALNELDPDVIVNCIGIVKQLKESDDFNISHMLNSEFPHKLCTYAKSHGMQVIHISTDCVFDGKTGMYTENSIPNATDIYGRTKFTGELHDINAVTLRTSIIGREIDTTHGLLEWFLSKKSGVVYGYEKSIFSGVTTNELSNLVGNIIFKGKNLSGLYHVAATPINKFDLLTMINSYLKPNERITINAIDGDIINRSLVGSKLKIAFNYSPPPWKNMLDEVMIKDKTNYR